MIDYKVNEPISVKQFIELLNKTTLGARRPLEDEKRVAVMLHHADLLVTAWDGERLVGVARSVTDFPTAVICLIWRWTNNIKNKVSACS